LTTKYPIVKEKEHSRVAPQEMGLEMVFDRKVEE
jgi:hypothetical protein